MTQTVSPTTEYPRPWHRRDSPRWYTPLTRGRAARFVLGLVLRRVPVAVRFPDGSVMNHGGPTAPCVDIMDPAALVRLESHPKIGLGEAYQAGEWRPAPGHDLAAVLLPFAERLSTAIPRPLLAMRRLIDRALPHDQRGTQAGARTNISAHYDLSNAMFAEFLDATMTYSSALFDDSVPWAEQALEQAQLRKIDAVLDAAGVRSGSRVLEIGTGWGELAVRAAQRGASVTSITLSQEQLDYAQAKVDAAGVNNAVHLQLCDYREVRGQFDAVVSVEMIEAVGEEYWPDYFGAIRDALVPGGTVAVQAIVMDDARLQATRRSFGWIQKHIFPGGLIPSVPALETVASDAGLDAVGSHFFGLHYAETLRRWRDQFGQRWPQVAALGFDDVFRRTWEFYLAYCEAGFASGYLDVGIIRWRRPLTP